MGLFITFHYVEAFLLRFSPHWEPFSPCEGLFCNVFFMVGLFYRVGAFLLLFSLCGGPFFVFIGEPFCPYREPFWAWHATLPTEIFAGAYASPPCGRSCSPHPGAHATPPPPIAARHPCKRIAYAFYMYLLVSIIR